MYLRDIWPSREEIQEIERKHVLPAMFEEVYSKLTKGNEHWNGLNAPDTQLYPWDEKSTYIQKPPFFAGMVCVGIWQCIYVLCVCMCLRVFLSVCLYVSICLSMHEYHMYSKLVLYRLRSCLR